MWAYFKLLTQVGLVIKTVDTSGRGFFKLLTQVGMVI